MNVTKLEQKLELTFNDDTLVELAFTHSSYVNEHRETVSSDNERLEFLGDAVLELAVSEYLYREYPDMPEGEMTKLRAAIVCEPSLHYFAYALDFSDYLLLGKGEEQSGGRKRAAVLADAFEAFLGALYLDQGFNTVVRFMESFIFPKLQAGAFSHGMDYKSQLQEFVQQYRNTQVEYHIVEEKGPSHNKEFVSEVMLNGSVYGRGIGHSKKEAEQRAAKHALDTETGFL